MGKAAIIGEYGLDRLHDHYDIEEGRFVTAGAAERKISAPLRRFYFFMGIFTLVAVLVVGYFASSMYRRNPKFQMVKRVAKIDQIASSDSAIAVEIRKRPLVGSIEVSHVGDTAPEPDV